MKRDMDVIRAILLELERHGGNRGIGNIDIEGYSQEDIRYNVYLLHQGGFIEGAIRYGVGSVQPRGFDIQRMTWAGHDFLDAIRNDTVWAKVKGKLARVGGDAPFDVVKAVAVKAALELIS
jgi:hypothetical protein